MKRFILFLLIGFTSQISFSQDRCLDLIKKISKDWKSDSLTKDGFRMSIFKVLRASTPDSLSPADLTKYLGKPFQVQKFGSGITRKDYIQYIYFYWDSYTIPHESPFERLYIAFVFDNMGNHLLYIDDGMYCH